MRERTRGRGEGERGHGVEGGRRENREGQIWKRREGGRKGGDKGMLGVGREERGIGLERRERQDERGREGGRREEGIHIISK